MTQDPLRTALEARLGAQYEIESLLGQGGMGSVYRAIDRTLHRPVAIKVISGDLALNPQLKERFLLEARTVAKLRHPNIVAVYSAGEADGLLYFVMELVPGESLRDLLSRDGALPPERAERILHELALALDYAHANGIVHRDVKPENILLDRETGRAMLTDFGVARSLENSGNMTGTAADHNVAAVNMAASHITAAARAAEGHAAAAQQVSASTEEQSAACEEMSGAANALLAGSVRLREIVAGLRA